MFPGMTETLECVYEVRRRVRLRNVSGYLIIAKHRNSMPNRNARPVFSLLLNSTVVALVSCLVRTAHVSNADKTEK